MSIIQKLKQALQGNPSQSDGGEGGRVLSDRPHSPNPTPGDATDRAMEQQNPMGEKDSTRDETEKRAKGGE